MVALTTMVIITLLGLAIFAVFAFYRVTKRFEYLESKNNDIVVRLEENDVRAADRHKLEKADQRTIALIDALANAQDLEAIQVIARIAERGVDGSAFARAILLRLKQDRSAAVRIFAIDAISRLGDRKSTVDAVVVGLDDVDPAIQAYSARLAGRLELGDAPVIDKLKQFDQDDQTHYSVRRACRWTLQRFNIRCRGHREIEDAPKTHFGFVFIKSISSTSQLVKELIATKQYGLMRRAAGIAEISLLQGSKDIIARVIGEDQHSFGEFIMHDLQGSEWVESTETRQVIAMPLEEYWLQRPPEEPNTEKNISWVLISVPSTLSPLMLVAVRVLSEFAAVTEAATIYGDAEVLLKMEHKSQRELDRTSKLLQRIPYVRSTETFRVFEPIGKNHHRWTRDADVRIRQILKDFIWDKT